MVLNVLEELKDMSYYQAYQAYERRAVRGEFSVPPTRLPDRVRRVEPALSRLGDLFIRFGWYLKRRQAGGKTMAWSPLTASKP